MYSGSSHKRGNAERKKSRIGLKWFILVLFQSSSNPKWHNAALILEDCLKRRGLRALDRALSRDIITITDNVVLIRRKNDSELLSRYDR